jgi:signal transduction histidine kinase
MSNKTILIICAAGLIGCTFYSYRVINQLRKNDHAAVEVYTGFVQSTIKESMTLGEIKAVLDKFISKSNSSVIVTDSAWEPQIWYNVYYRKFLNNLLIPEKDLNDDQRIYLAKTIEKSRQKHAPGQLVCADSSVKFGYLLLVDNDQIKSLSFMPFVTLGFIAAFVLMIYFVFFNIRSTERSNLWVGLAKETAHQLGTPISALMGWVEYMRLIRETDPPVTPEVFMEQNLKICLDMEHDLKRLGKVTARFSQIGSSPALSKCDINELLHDISEYFRARLPLMHKHIDIKFEFGDIPKAYVNKDLLEWVFENLLKNSIDAMNRDDGVITISTEYIERSRIIRVNHRDNGIGISHEAQKKIFAPGFTTKRRGWGLGLTLAKRVVEDYHNGKIYISWSQKDKGTVFCVDLPVKADSSSVNRGNFNVKQS